MPPWVSRISGPSIRRAGWATMPHGAGSSSRMKAYCGFPGRPSKFPLLKSLPSWTKAELQPADQQLPLVDHLRRQVIVEHDEQLIVVHDFILPLGAVDGLEVGELFAGHVEAFPVHVFVVRGPACLLYTSDAADDLLC